MSRARHKRILKRQRQFRKMERFIQSATPVVWFPDFQSAARALAEQGIPIAAEGDTLNQTLSPDMDGVTFRELLP